MSTATGYAQKVIEALYENGDPVSIDAAELLERLTIWLGVKGLMISSPVPRTGTTSYQCLIYLKPKLPTYNRPDPSQKGSR
jgi:hypothetical protein